MLLVRRSFPWLLFLGQHIGFIICKLIYNLKFSFPLKARAELEEIALAEADVARLKQKVAELHLQLNQQHQQHFGSITDASNRYQNLPAHLSQL